jgi:hypothetical protein
MYNNNNNNSHPDPFAGQYPPPPSLTSPIVEPQPQIQNTFSTPIQHYQESDYNHVNYTSTPPAPPPPSQPLHQQEVYFPPPIPAYSDNNYHNNSYNQQQQQPSYYSSNLATDEERNIGVSGNEQPLEDYLRQEREEYMKHENNNNKSTPYNEYNNVLGEEKEPMVQKQEESSRPSRKERKRIEKLKQEAAATYQPYVTKPALAPQENEAESYRPKPYEKERKGGCDCCCYNPAITCCSFFCLLISIAFCCAGIALIIASKVVSDKCNNECANVIDQAQSACGTICSKVLHDGMFYGGIVVAGLSAIAIIWKLIMWTCAGYSQRR